MNFIALLLGALASFNPPIGLFLTMVYSRFSLLRKPEAPHRDLLLFFVFPLAFAALFYKQPGSLLVASDAVFGVGLVAFLFLYSFSRNARPYSAFTLGSVLIVAYGLARHFLFGPYLLQAHNQAMAEMARLYPQIMQNGEFAASLSMARRLILASWTVPQVLALFLGLVVFLNLNKARFRWSEFAVPHYYNLLILAALPLYLAPNLRTVFLNTLLSLCVVPFLQGVGVLLHWASRYVSNVFGMVLLTILIILNAILVVLVGFADIWLDLRKLNLKGTYS